MRKLAMAMMCLCAPGMLHAMDCTGTQVPQAAPLRPTVLAPISSELATSSYQFGSQSSVLAQAYDESQSVEQVLLRLRIEGCQNVAKAIPAPSALDPNDPAAYKPKTEFDNTPWRFDMSQNGKKMTAEEFDAWMKSRGVRVAKGGAKMAPAAAVPAEVAVGAAAVDAGQVGADPGSQPAATTPPAAPQPAAAPEPTPKP